MVLSPACTSLYPGLGLGDLIIKLTWKTRKTIHFQPLTGGGWTCGLLADIINQVGSRSTTTHPHMSSAWAGKQHDKEVQGH